MSWVDIHGHASVVQLVRELHELMHHLRVQAAVGSSMMSTLGLMARAPARETLLLTEGELLCGPLPQVLKPAQVEASSMRFLHLLRGNSGSWARRPRPPPQWWRILIIRVLQNHAHVLSEGGKRALVIPNLSALEETYLSLAG